MAGFPFPPSIPAWKFSPDSPPVEEFGIRGKINGVPAEVSWRRGEGIVGDDPDAIYLLQNLAEDMEGDEVPVTPVGPVFRTNLLRHPLAVRVLMAWLFDAAPEWTGTPPAIKEATAEFEDESAAQAIREAEAILGKRQIIT